MDTAVVRSLAATELAGKAGEFCFSLEIYTIFSTTDVKANFGSADRTAAITSPR
jgi:hypothetical protein